MFFIGTLLFLCASISANAQGLSGRVVDSAGQSVSGADIKVSARGEPTLQSTTDQNGAFSFAERPAGAAVVHVTAVGFAPYKAELGDLAAGNTIVLSPNSLMADVTVHVTRAESALSQTPASVIVLDRAALDRSPAQTVDDRLRHVAGFSLFRRSSSRSTNPTAQGASLRGVGGSGAARTAVLFDGLPLNDAFGGWTYWSRAPRISIDRIEVLRGGASSLYGSSALSGVINIETPAKGEPKVRFEASAGSQGTYDAGIYASGDKWGWIVDLAAESFRTEGYIPVSEEQRGAADSRADSRHNSGFLTIGRQLNKNIYSFVRGNLFSERRANGTVLTNNRTYFRQIAFGTNIEAGDRKRIQLRAAIDSQVYDQSFSAVSADRNSENLTRIQRVPSYSKRANLFWTGSFGRHGLSAAGEIFRVTGFSDETVINSGRVTAFAGAGGGETSGGLFIQDHWQITDRLTLSIGGRFDRWYLAGAHSTARNASTGQTTVRDLGPRAEHSFSPRAAAIYRISNRISVLGSYSKAFRAPSLNELYRDFRVGNILTLANSELDAERADTFEGGAHFTELAGRLRIRGTVYLTEVENPVVSLTLSASPTLITRQRRNVGRTRTTGTELDAEFAPGEKLRLAASYLFADSRVASFPGNEAVVDRFLPQIPKHQMTFQAVVIPRNDLSFTVQGRAAGRQFEDDHNTLVLRPYFSLDLSALYKAAKRFEIFAAVENLLDRRYDIGLTPARTQGPPRFVRLGLRFDLGRGD